MGSSTEAQRLSQQGRLDNLAMLTIGGGGSVLPQRALELLDLERPLSQAELKSIVFCDADSGYNEVTAATVKRYLVVVDNVWKTQYALTFDNMAQVESEVLKIDASNNDGRVVRICDLDEGLDVEWNVLRNVSTSTIAKDGSI